MQNGIYSNITDLLGFRFLVKRKKLSHQQTLISAKGGYHQAIRKGRGMSFTEVREYQAGDEIRHIDWKVSARTQKTHTKVFTEELEKPIICITEQSSRLFFGSQVRFKSVQAMNISAIIGWIALNHGDKFGGQVFNNQQSYWQKAKQNHKFLLQFLNNSIELQAQTTSPIGTSSSPENLWTQQLELVYKQVDSGNRLFLIGDFLKQPADFFQQLSHLKKRNQVVLIHLFDPLEKNLPKTGLFSFSNGLAKLNFNAGLLHNEYKLAYDNAWQELKNNCGKFHIPVIEVDSSRDPVAELLAQKVIN
jgi:uncharacterized protein (DUF58 family)